MTSTNENVWKSGIGAAVVVRRGSRSRPLLLFLVSLYLSICSLSVTVHGLRVTSPTYDYENDGVFPHIVALFAPDPHTYNVTAPVVWLADNKKFCEVDESANLSGKIVLAERGEECRFDQRALNAAKAGAVGLIIGNNNPNSRFDTPFLGPYQQNPTLVNIPVLLILQSAYKTILDHPNTTATINDVGLVYDFSDYENGQEAKKYQSVIKAVVILSPFVVVVYSLYTFYLQMRDRAPSPQQQQQQPRPAQAQGQGQGQGQEQGQEAQQVQQAAEQQAAPAQDRPPSPSQSAASLPSEVHANASSRRGSGLMEGLHEILLPVPPHLSTGETQPGDSVASASSSAGSMSRDHGHDSSSSIHHSRPSVRSSSIGGEDDAQTLLHDRPRRSSSTDVDVDLGAAAAAAASSSHGQRSSSPPLARPFLHTPAIGLGRRIYYHTLKALSLAGKPYAIMRVNSAFYAFHALSSFIVLILGYNESCLNISQQALVSLGLSVSLWFARAVIGWRICYWQTHSSSPQPTCLDLFFKNWCDCIFIFTGLSSTWSSDQRIECELSAPITFNWVRAWTVIIYITYGLRILMFLLVRFSQDRVATLPHLFPVASRSFLSLLNGGFSCAGPLDKNQPATQLDLMLIPTAPFHAGMFPPDDAICGVCLGEYSEGEELRLLPCSHHYHRECCDTWLLQRNTCPTCRSPIDDSRSNRPHARQPQSQPQPQAQPQQQHAREERGAVNANANATQSSAQHHQAYAQHSQAAEQNV